ncbi:uncharacterized protein EV422DRAFT_279048 [Fimicolochytrium jonesii]|uniref:uncharacterized protein n=1 Tax=Fimicolochytrium jonesii TaxID=1396493 RepID=UPI0022FDD9F2|nr:uncharacterized protein EV422DRAFT_279048 [Fimicolochytrium jonesii]KAI8816567.1 hypothetical protein EV422DRAFT_279048 [Fimicolochytrium jonesii]
MRAYVSAPSLRASLPLFVSVAATFFMFKAFAGSFHQSMPQWISTTHPPSDSITSENRECQWLPANLHESAKSLQPLLHPEFPLLEAWLRPDAARYGPAPKEIPAVLRNQFTLDRRIPESEFFFDQAYLGGSALVSEWTEQMIDEYRREVRERKPKFNYVMEHVYAAMDAQSHLIRGKRGLVIGSENPWLEALLLEYGARHISTLEFGEIKTDHPNIDTFTPKEFVSGILKETIPKYDFVFTYSSLEHDGLGRYGDILNPIGDLQTMARMLTVVVPGGFAFVGFPCCHDKLEWNAHRIYGPLRLPKMFAGWRVAGIYPEDALQVTDQGYGFQPVFLLQNTFGCVNGGISLPHQPWLTFAPPKGLHI